MQKCTVAYHRLGVETDDLKQLMACWVGCEPLNSLFGHALADEYSSRVFSFVLVSNTSSYFNENSDLSNSLDSQKREILHNYFEPFFTCSFDFSPFGRSMWLGCK